MLINLALGLPVMALCMAVQTLLVARVVVHYGSHAGEVSASGQWRAVLVLIV